MNITDLKKIIKDTVLEALDHRNLDVDVPYFRDRVSTTENVAVFIWEQLAPRIPPPAILHEILVHETDNNSVVYRGERI